jgi:lipoprotein signal peptidase
MPVRTYRWLLLSLAVIGLTADLVSKYHVFRWLYNNQQEANDGKFQAWVHGERWRDGGTIFIHGGRYDLVPGWLGLTADYDQTAAKCDCGFERLLTWSAPLMPRVNHGALFGMGGEHKGTANNIFAGVSVVAAIAILVWGMRRSTAREKWLMAALGLILGGTVGNLYDRIVFNGVRDFLYFYAIEWPVFNVADCCLVVGAGLLLIQAVFAPPPPEEAPEGDEIPATTDAPKA